MARVKVNSDSNESNHEGKSIVFFDGVCKFCNSTVNLLLKLDKNKVFCFATLQSKTASKLRSKNVIPQETDSIIYLKDGKSYLRSQAIFEIAKDLPWPWKITSFGRHIPLILTDMIYCFWAKNRFRIFGKYDSCRIPTKEDSAQFLEDA